MRSLYFTATRYKASFTLSRFSVPVALRCGHRGPPGPHRSDAGKHRVESGYTVLTGVNREVVPVVSNL